MDGLQIEYIIGGSKAEEGDILYQTSLLIKGYTDTEPDAPCAAATVNNNHLVTIASCFVDEFGDPFQRWYEVKVGAINLNNRSKVVGVEKIYIPANYNWRSSANNIAVVKLNESLDFSLNTHLSRVELPTTRSSFRKRIAILSAYGYHRINILSISQYAFIGNRDWHLRSLPVKVMENSKCKRSWPGVLDNQLCGLSIPDRRNLQAGACVGDLGGPLVFENMLIGVLSKFNPLCSDTNHPSVYTRITSVQSFIQSVLDGRPPEDAVVYTDPTDVHGNVAMTIS